MPNWIHHDPEIDRRARRQLDAHASGIAVVQPISESVADFRAWLVDRAYLIARLVGTVDTAEGGYTRIDPVGSSPAPERLEAARALYAPCVVLAQELGETPPRALETHAPTGAGDVGNLGVVAVAVIVVGAVVAIGLLANQGGLVVDRQLERQEQTRRMLAKDTAVRDIVDKHIAREDQQKKAIPLDDSEKLALQELAAQSRAAAAELPRYPSVLDPALTKAPAIGAGIGLAGGLGLLAAAAAVWMFWNTTR